MTDSQTSYEDVPGADKAGREIRARDYAVMQEIAIRTGKNRDQQRVIESAAAAGLIRELRPARRELVRVYGLDDRNPDDALAVLREMIEPAIDDSHPDDPGVEDYQRSDGVPL